VGLVRHDMKSSITIYFLFSKATSDHLSIAPTRSNSFTSITTTRPGTSVDIRPDESVAKQLHKALILASYII
jgi:hypothetical protein